MEGHVEQDVDSLASLVGSLSTEESGRIVEQIDGGERRWKSVLPLLDAASDEMALGDLVAGKTFDLHDAMSAIEIMDKQMDSGMEKERPADEPTAPPPPPGEDASPRLVIAVLDEVMCAEQGWYKGLSLAQTLWRLEWLQNADEVRSMPLRSALIATARAVAATHAIVTRGDVHEEEDFASSLSGLNLHNDVSDQELIGMLNETEEACAAAVEAAAAEKASAEAASAEVAVVAAATEALALAEGMLCRLRLRRGWCGALIQLARPTAKSVEVAKRMLSLAAAQMGAVRETMRLGMARDELAYCLGGITLRLQLGTSPKKVEPLAREAALAERTSLIAQLQTVCTAGELLDYEALVRWLEDLCGCVRPMPSILTRSAAQLVGVSEDRQGAQLRPPLAGLLPVALALYSGVSEAQLAELLPLPIVSEFIGQLAHGEVLRLRLLNVNRGRTRRRLRHYLHDWAPLQDLAENLDSELQRAGYLDPGLGPFGAWVLHRTMRDMTRFITLGFELELYGPCELIGIYWYLDLLAGMQLQLQKEVHDRACAKYAELVAAAQAAQREAKDGGKKGKKAAKAKAAALPDPPVVGGYATHFELLFTRVTAELSRGTCLLLSALSRLGFIAPYESEFMPLSRRFERRFAPFNTLARPPPLGPQHFEHAKAQLDASPVEGLLSTAANHFKSVKTRLDAPIKAETKTDGTTLSAVQKAEAMAYAKVAVANGVLIASLSLKPPAAGSVVKFGYAAHPHFVQLSLAPPPVPKAK